MVAVKNCKWFFEYFGELNQILGVDSEFVYVQGLATGFPAMIRLEVFTKEVLQNA
jgi:hypothetical protein